MKQKTYKTTNTYCLAVSQILDWIAGQGYIPSTKNSSRDDSGAGVTLVTTP